MKLRKRILPKTIGDALGIAFCLIMFPICYWFEVFIALPLYFEDNQFYYKMHFVLSSFLLYNTVSNFLAIFLVDSSTEGVIIPSDLKATWRFCPVCESISPPRSWHCSVCDGCILKRDHHCNFTACCIGHHNHRYFIVFLFYLSLGTLYCTYFNIYYLWRFSSFTSLSSLAKLIMPLAVLVLGSDTSLIQLYRFICIISIVGMFAVVTLFVYHVLNLVKGVTMYEKNKKNYDYDLGSPLENVKQALGVRWYVTVLSPFSTSKLPHDGIHWDDIKMCHQKLK